jgi:hypothetical protein
LWACSITLNIFGEQLWHAMESLCEQYGNIMWPLVRASQEQQWDCENKTWELFWNRCNLLGWKIIQYNLLIDWKIIQYNILVDWKIIQYNLLADWKIMKYHLLVWKIMD